MNLNDKTESKCACAQARNALDATGMRRLIYSTEYEVDRDANVALADDDDAVVSASDDRQNH